MRLQVFAILAVSAAGAAALSFADADAHTQGQPRGYRAYAIIDFETDRAKEQIIEAAERVLVDHASDFQSNRPVVVRTPRRAGRLQLIDPLIQSGLDDLAALGGVNAKPLMIATCDGAVWTADISRMLSGAQRLTVQLCLFPYRDDEREGYQLDLYASDTPVGGAEIPERSSRAAGFDRTLTPRAFTETMLRQTVRAIEDQTGAPAVLVEGEPEIPGLASSEYPQ